MLISPDLKALKFKTPEHLQPFCQGEGFGQQLYQTLVTGRSDVHLTQLSSLGNSSFVEVMGH